MDDPNLITSGLSRTVTMDSSPVRIEIVRIEGNPDWTLEVVDVEGTSVVWQEPFETDTAALSEAIRAIEEEGAKLFLDDSNVIPFPG
jgi:hypothetical protein